MTAATIPFSVLPTTRFLGPRDLYPQLRTEAEYLELQRASILAKRAQFQTLNWRMPFLHDGAAPFKVSDGMAQVVCVYSCGNYPSYDAEWGLACCFTCGAIYRQAPPEDWLEIERVLINRPNPASRHMLPGQTLDELRAENRAHGDPD